MTHTAAHVPVMGSTIEEAPCNTDRPDCIESVRILHNSQLGYFGDELCRDCWIGNLRRVRHARTETAHQAGELLVGVPGQHQLVDVGRRARSSALCLAVGGWSVFLVIDIMQQTAQHYNLLIQHAQALLFAAGIFDLEKLEGHGQDGEDVVEVVGGVELGAVGHVGFAEEGGGADEGIGRDFGDEGGIERRIGAGLGLDGNGVGAFEGLEGGGGVLAGGRHGDGGRYCRKGWEVGLEVEVSEAHRERAGRQ